MSQSKSEREVAAALEHLVAMETLNAEMLALEEEA